MTWGEALRLTKILGVDPSSQVGAAFQGWAFALSRETAAVLDLFDLQNKAQSKQKPKPHPARPWATDTTKRIAKPSVSQADVRAALAAAGHH